VILFAGWYQPLSRSETISWVMDLLGTIEDGTILLHGLQAARLSPPLCPSPDGKTAAVSGVLLSWPGFPENGAA
jgi:hypothetical protein